MNGIKGKKTRLRLKPENYQKLHRQILERDSWRCQNCGSMHNLQVHHFQTRSRAGSDHERNLITYCVYCHAGTSTFVAERKETSRVIARTAGLKQKNLQATWLSSSAK